MWFAGAAQFGIAFTFSVCGSAIETIASWDSVRAVRSRRPAPSSRRRVFLSPRLSCVRKPLLRTVSSTVTLRPGASFALADAVLRTLGLSRASRLGASHLPWLGVCQQLGSGLRCPGGDGGQSYAMVGR